MDNWEHLAATFYYTGVGAVLLCTAVRFLYRLVKGYDQDREFLQELKEVHLTNINLALHKIAAKLNIDLEVTPLGRKPLPEDSWKQFDSHHL